MAKQNLNVNGDTLPDLGCHECAHSQAGSMIITGGFILVCSITERPALERCYKWEYEQIKANVELRGDASRRPS